MKLEEKVVVITGAGSGIGKAAAVLFAKEGANVQVLDINYPSANETADLIKEQGGNAEAFQCNVVDREQIISVVNNIKEKHNKIDVIFNNAGAAMEMQDTEKGSVSEVDKLLDINIKGVLWGLQAVIPIMKKQNSGVILNTASMQGRKPKPKLSIYGASKAAVINLTKGVALELGEYGIRVFGLNPAAVKTELLKDFIGNNSDYEENIKGFESTIPLGRLATAEEVAKAALFLISDEASMLTGNFIDVDGGRGI